MTSLMMSLIACSTIKQSECIWVEDNLITSSEAKSLSIESKRNIIRHEKNYDKFCTK
jgi:hypothetical protein